MFTVLCEKYQTSISRDPSYKEVIYRSFFKTILCTINLTIVLYGSVNPHRILSFNFWHEDTIIDMKIQKLVTFNGCSVYLFN